ncbi:Hypothetical_protein [Hexamita inflata]|uniref:Hypothetical_protein n=1 Tax=Hexamita inflata TaxID=28002 RepID=A0AA86TJ10_9EUKA|nr:Hypothetical protein HINF_LOCUS6600 [Hexamita inflata]
MNQQPGYEIRTNLTMSSAATVKYTENQEIQLKMGASAKQHYFNPETNIFVFNFIKLITNVSSSESSSNLSTLVRPFCSQSIVFPKSLVKQRYGRWQSFGCCLKQNTIKLRVRTKID